MNVPVNHSRNYGSSLSVKVHEAGIILPDSCDFAGVYGDVGRFVFLSENVCDSSVVDNEVGGDLSSCGGG